MSCRVCGCPCSDLCESCVGHEPVAPIYCRAGCGSVGPLVTEPDGTRVCSSCYLKRGTDTLERAAQALAKAVVDDIEKTSKEAEHAA
jgi:hypothetical protein